VTAIVKRETCRGADRSGSTREGFISVVPSYVRGYIADFHERRSTCPHPSANKILTSMATAEFTGKSAMTTGKSIRSKTRTLTRDRTTTGTTTIDRGANDRTRRAP
jgi:hypothetical protein